MLSQQQFDFSDRAPKPMENASMDNWIEKNDVQYHGSFRSDWHNSPVAHFGKIGQAVTRLNMASRIVGGSAQNRANYYNGSSEDPVDWEDDSEETTEKEPQTHTGRVYAHRIDPAAPVTFSDADANAGEMAHRLQSSEDWEIPASIKQSIPDNDKPVFDESNNTSSGHTARAQVAERALGRGQPIKYKNIAEGDNEIDGHQFSWDRRDTPTSTAAPRFAHHSWEDDVLHKDSGASRAAQDYAKQRIDQGTEGSVPFPSITAPGHIGEQSRLNVGSDYGGANDLVPRINGDHLSAPRRTLSSIQFQTSD